MAILFVLLTFLLIITVTYFRHPHEPLQAAAQPPSFDRPPVAPRIARELGFEIPKGYCFHPGHTWVLDEGRQNARIGMDAFTANLFDKVDRIEVAGLNRWVRQGQKLWTITSGELSFDMLSPIEGVVTSVNHEVVKDPSLALKDPYNMGWICVVKSPEISTNLKNLIQGPLVGPWMQNSVMRVNAMAQQLSPQLMQDGGVPVKGLINHLEPGVQRKVVQEFLLA